MGSEAPDILLSIVSAVQDRLAREPASPGLERRAREAAGVRRRGDRRSLRAALAAPGVRVIAECKRKSPVRGWLRQDFEPGLLARSYEQGGAAAVSVVTEPQFFAGQAGWVPLIRQVVGLPVLQKDFLISPRQLAEASLLSADAVLLIVRVLPGGLLNEMLAVAAELELEVLAEVYDEVDLERILTTGAPLVGINARDLRTFQVAWERASALAALVPPDRLAVLESGVQGREDVARAGTLGLRRFLVGEHLIRAADPAKALTELMA